MKFKLTLLLLILFNFSTFTQTILINENFQDWTPLTIAQYTNLPFYKNLFQSQLKGKYLGSYYSVFPTHTIGSDIITNRDFNPSPGCLVLTNHLSFLQLPELPSIGLIEINANAHTDQSSFKLLTFKDSSWVYIPGTFANVSKNEIKHYLFNIGSSSPVLIKIVSNQDDSLNIWDIKVSSCLLKLPKLDLPENVHINNINPTSFNICWDKVEDALGYEVRIYNNEIGLIKTYNIDNNHKSEINVSGLLSGIMYAFKVIAKGNGVTFQDSEPYSDSITTLTQSIHNAPRIIFKFDDIKVKKGVCLSLPTIDFLANNRIKSSYGVIAVNCDTTSKATLSPYITALNDSNENLVEIWNHGFDHLKINSLAEFSGTGYDYQKKHFYDATQIVKKNMGVQMHSFGTPWNQSDSITNRVVSEDPEYKVFMCLPGQVKLSKQSNFIILDNFVNMEYDTGKPIYNYFVSNYNANKYKYKDFMVVQGHPENWKLNSPEFIELTKIIDFIKNQGCDFALPYDYYIDKTLLPPSNLGYKFDKSLTVKLTWQDNSVSEEIHRVERSSDMKNWSLRGVCNKDTMSFSDDSISIDTLSYYYRVSATNKNKSVYSSVIKVNLSDTNLFQLKSENINIRLYPNPCKNEISVIGSFAESDMVSCEIYNQLGKMEKPLFEGKILMGDYNFKFNLNLSPGLYFCNFKTNKGTVVKKIIVTGN